METKRHLEWRNHNAGDTILLVENRPPGNVDRVVGAWPVEPQSIVDFLAVRDGREDVGYWSETWPDETDPDAFGVIQEGPELGARLEFHGDAARPGRRGRGAR